jgi:hypothetical protein
LLGFLRGAVVDAAALRLFVMAVAGWWAEQQQASVAYLVQENRILRIGLRGRIRLTDKERRRLAVHGHRLGRRGLGQIATIVTSALRDETERMASTAVDVECHAGYSGEETPRRFHLGERQVEIAEVVCATRLPSIVC